MANEWHGKMLSVGRTMVRCADADTDLEPIRSRRRMMYFQMEVANSASE